MKKILASIMASAMVMTSVISASAAVTEEEIIIKETPATYGASAVVANEPTTEELEQMIKLVKPKLDVPEECTEFDWNYTSANYYRAASWRMTWRDKDYTKAIRVNCDSKGNITSYTYNDYSNSYSAKLPEYSKSELEAVAKDFLEKLAPEAAKSMVLTESYSNGFYGQSFNYRFVRYENGVIVPDNTASVSVNYITGVPTSLSVAFNHGIEFEDIEEIPAEDAKKALNEEQKMILSYRLKNEYDEDGNLMGRTAYLVYTPAVSYLSADAKTGEVYTERNTWNIIENDDVTSDLAFGTANGVLKGEAAESEEGEYRLSEEELAQLEVLKNLISREEAIKAITDNSYLYLDPEATAVEADLVQTYSYDYYRPANYKDSDTDTYVWNLYFSAPYNASKENGYYRAYANATVDAKDGTLISFNSSVPGYSYYEASETTDKMPELKYAKEDAGKIFSDFAATIIPDYVKNSRISEAYDSVVYNYIADKDGERIPVYRTASINLVRVNEGIDFTYNNISGAVDLATGKITRFSYNWYDDVTFESPKDAITPEEAYRVLLDSDGFGLNYEINSNYTYNKYLEDEKNGLIDYDKLYTTEQYSRLVYSGYNYLSTTVSALKGELINYSGTPVERETPTEYTDITGHWAEKDIRTLLDLGFVFEGTEFKPDSYITNEEYQSLMQFLGNYVNVEETEEVNASAALTRTDAVKYIIAAAGYGKIAAMPDIFITDFADNSDLKREDVGFIAIARGLGLVQGNLGEFRPYDDITRAEAVTLAFNYVKLSD